MPNSRQCIICNDRYLSSLNDILFNNKIKNANKNFTLVHENKKEKSLDNLQYQ